MADDPAAAGYPTFDELLDRVHHASDMAEVHDLTLLVGDWAKNAPGADAHQESTLRHGIVHRATLLMPMLGFPAFKPTAESSRSVTVATTTQESAARRSDSNGITGP